MAYLSDVQKWGMAQHTLVFLLFLALNARKTRKTRPFLQLVGIAATRPPDATPPPWGGHDGGRHGGRGCGRGCGRGIGAKDSYSYLSTRPPAVKGVGRKC